MSEIIDIYKTDPALQAYYEYDPRQSGEWWRKEAPDPEGSGQNRFNRELALTHGYTNGKPNYRVVWGGTEMHDITEKRQLKYMQRRQIVHGYRYLTKSGEHKFVKKGQQLSMEERAEIDRQAGMVPVKSWHEFGRLRWIIERYLSPELLKQQGRFQHLHNPETGEKILRDFPNEGIYTAFFVVQTHDHKYRGLDDEVLDAVNAMIVFNIKEWEAQAGLDMIEMENQQTLLGADGAGKVWEGLHS